MTCSLAPRIINLMYGLLPPFPLSSCSQLLLTPVKINLIKCHGRSIPPSRAPTAAPKDIWLTFVTHEVHREAWPPWAGTGPGGKWKPTPGNCRCVRKCKWQERPTLECPSGPIGTGRGKELISKVDALPVNFHHRFRFTETRGS